MDAAPGCSADDIPNTRPGDHPMSDEFETAAGPGMTAEELEKLYTGKYLSAVDVGDRKLKTRILGVHAEELRQQDGTMRKKAVLSLEGLDKQLVVNVTNKAILTNGLGRNPQKWTGRAIGLKTVPRNFGGKVMNGIEIVILGEAFTAKGSSGLKPKQPKPTAKTHGDFPADDLDDPGFEPDESRDYEENAA
jgi:hypothetical protein